MGCVSSNLLNHEDDFTQLGSSALGHHIVSLTSTTYGLLTLDPPQSSTSPPTPPSRFTLASIFPAPLSEPEVINSWELMAGLDADSFRFSPIPKTFSLRDPEPNKENSNPNSSLSNMNPPVPKAEPGLKLDRFEKLCPPNGESRVVIYTTTLRGVRKTFEACNAVRAAIEGLGVSICERDISMDRGFREELRELMRGKEKDATVPPRVFVKGWYVGGAEEVLKIVEEGWILEHLEGLPRKRSGSTVCEGCGDARFLPCFRCNGSCKIVMEIMRSPKLGSGSRGVVIRCPDCNENGLVLCPLCY